MTAGACAVAGLLTPACRDVSGFSTQGDHFEGPVVQANFVRAGIDPSTTMCLTIDTNHLQDAPGALWTSDGRFAATALRPVPQIWHDPLSTLSFGQGRTKNLVYVASAQSTDADLGGESVAIVSLMDSGNIEVRLLRGAPGGPASDAGTPSPANLFAVFNLQRRSGACPF